MSFIFFPTDPNTMNRSEIQQNLVECIVDGLDMEMLCQLASDVFSTTYDGYSDSELLSVRDKFRDSNRFVGDTFQERTWR